MADDIDKLRNLAMGARDIMQEEAFAAAIDILQKEYTSKLVISHDMNQTLDLIAKIRVLDDIPKALTKLMNDYTGAARKEGRRA
jgi:hypothetical protein